MTLQSVLNWIQFVTTGNAAVGLSLQDEIRGAITALYRSPTAQVILEDASRRSLLSFQADPLLPTQQSAPINVNMSDVNRIYWFNDRGTVVKASLDLVLLHELKHAVAPGNALDPGAPGYAPSDGDVNQASWITDGPAVEAQNAVARQLGRSNEVRVSYYGADVLNAFGIFVPGRQYTEGQVIDSVRVGIKERATGASGLNIDESARATDLRNLIFGASGDHTINAAAGNDWVYGGGGKDTLRGGTGNDVIYGDDKFDFTMVGDDFLYGDAGNDKLFGGKGLDEVRGGVGFDTLSGGEGTDKLFGEDGNDTIFGDFGTGESSELEEGVDHGDTIEGGKGIDTIDGQAGNDIIKGGDGNDIIKSGNDEDNNDENELFGEAGNDRLIFDGGGGTADGGKGNDTIELVGADAPVTVNYTRGEGLDVLIGETTPTVTLNLTNMAIAARSSSNFATPARSGPTCRGNRTGSSTPRPIRAACSLSARTIQPRASRSATRRSSTTTFPITRRISIPDCRPSPTPPHRRS